MSADQSSGSAAKKVPQPIEIVVDSNDRPGMPQATSEPTTTNGFEQEMPTVTTLLQRKKLSSAKTSSQPAIAPVEVAHPVMTAEPTVTPSRRRISRSVSPDEAPTRMTNSGISVVRSRSPGAPPEFRGRLALEELDLRAFEKALKKHKRSSDMRKLDCLGYFSRYFSEMAYFAAFPSGFKGALGYGNPRLVTQLRGCALTAQQVPSLFGMLSQQECFVGTIESLRAEDQSGLAAMGFSATAFIGVFPIISARQLRGVWICTARAVGSIPEKELKKLKKLLADLEL